MHRRTHEEYIELTRKNPQTVYITSKGVWSHGELTPHEYPEGEGVRMLFIDELGTLEEYFKIKERR